MAHPQLSAQNLNIGYGEKLIVEDFSLNVPAGRFSVIIGPNACGKSTLLRAIARVHSPSAGEVRLDGVPILSLPSKHLARQMGFLPQASEAPDGMKVRELVSRGRYPHHGLFQRWSEADEIAVTRALDLAQVCDLAERDLTALSGGQRQRVWIAMVLAQETPILLLDEPTTYLDLAHQVELLALLRRLNRAEGRTIVAVLHDLNLACRFADHLIAMRAGKIVSAGSPTEIVDAGLIQAVFGLEALVIADPVSDTPLIVPLDIGATALSA